MIVEIKDCWNLSNGTMIADIGHSFNGLPEGTRIYYSRDNYWTIVSRIMFGHTHDQQRIFACEKTTRISFSFESKEKRASSAQRTLDSEAKGIYQYILKGDVKVEKGEYRARHEDLITIADEKEEQTWKELFKFPNYSPAYWAARHGHRIGCGDLRKYIFPDKEFEKWVHELFAILHSDDRDELRKQVLSPEELKLVEKEIEMGF